MVLIILGAVRLRKLGLAKTLVCAFLLAIPSLSFGDDPRGVFSISNFSKQPQAVVLANPDVDGITLRQQWSELEPTEGTYDWTYLDSAVASSAAAGKQVLLRIGTAAAGRPAWVTTAVQNAGGLFFTFSSGGVPTTIPVFWDPTFIAKKTDMIAALGAHFATNPAVTIVWVSFSNATSEDWNVPHTPIDVVDWFAVGYTSDKMLLAAQQIIDATMVAFPYQTVTLAVGGSGHVKGLNLDPTSDYVARTAVGNARLSWPGRLNVQKNDLSAVNPIAPGTGTLYQMIWDFQPEVGGQMVFQCFNDPSYRANGGVPADPAVTLQKSVDSGVSYGENYIEIYQTDVVNLPAVITYAHGVLTGSSAPFRR